MASKFYEKYKQIMEDLAGNTSTGTPAPSADPNVVRAKQQLKTATISATEKELQALKATP